MSTKTSKGTAQRMSDEAVKAKTGRVWKEWFTILDCVGAKKMTHQEIAKYLHTEEGVGPWWTQMVTVTYEQARGLRDKHQKPDGYQISVSRTVNAPLAMLFESFANEKARNTWLGEEELLIRTATKNKSLRVTWSDKKTSLEILFLAKSETKSVVTIQHSKLSTDKVAARMKLFWKKALDRLQTSVEE